MYMLQEACLACVLLSLTFSSGQQTQQLNAELENTTPTSQNCRSEANANPMQVNPMQELVRALQTNGVTNTDLFMASTPATPAPQNINCYVEVPITVRRGGRCVRMGRGRGRRSRFRPWACQSGIHLDISPHCQRIMTSRSRRRGRG